MKEYHLHPDGYFLIRENGKVVASLDEKEITQFSSLSLPQGCTEVLIMGDGLVYATINKSMEAIPYNPLKELIEKTKDIINFYEQKIIEKNKQEQQEQQE